MISRAINFLTDSSNINERFDIRAYLLVVLIFFSTLQSTAPIYKILVLTLSFVWFFSFAAKNSSRYNKIYFSRSQAAVISALLFVFTGKAITAILFANTGLYGFITNIQFVQRWGSQVILLGFYVCLFVILMKTKSSKIS